MDPFEHVCEVCGKVETLTADAAYEQGWDYPPRMYEWGVISPRTCGSCGIEGTVWWALATENKGIDDLTPGQRMTVARILNEVSD